MKKIIFAICFALILFTFSKLQAQDWSSFVQFSGAAQWYGGFMFKGEYGKTYKWLDLSFSMNYAASMPMEESGFYITASENGVWTDTSPRQNGEYRDVLVDSHTLLAINAKIDIVRFFVKDSRHAFKIGGEFGLQFWQYFEYKDWTNAGWSTTYDVSNIIKPATSVYAAYEFDITKQLSLGAFYNVGGYITPCLGLSIRQNF
jgi:hypothetical protein